jgi:hypothetical protein
MIEASRLFRGALRALFSFPILSASTFVGRLTRSSGGGPVPLRAREVAGGPRRQAALDASEPSKLLNKGDVHANDTSPGAVITTGVSCAMRYRW